MIEDAKGQIPVMGSYLVERSPVDIIRGEIIANITMMVRAMAWSYDMLKDHTGLDDNQLYALLATAGANDLLADHLDYEGAARNAGWKTADLTPGLLVRGIVGQPLAEAATSWKEAAADLVIPVFPIRQVYVVAPNLYAQLSILNEHVADICGLDVWANWRDEEQTVEFFKALYNQRMDLQMDEAIRRTMERHKSALNETEAQQRARDKWEANAS